MRVSVLGADLVEDEGELLDGGDDDLLAGLDEAAEVAGVFGVADGGADLGELLDGVADLLVEDAAVGDDDDRVEDVAASSLLERDELVGEPGNGVGLAAACGVLDQVASAGPVVGGVGEEFANDVELVVARARSGSSASCRCRSSLKSMT